MTKTSCRHFAERVVTWSCLSNVESVLRIKVFQSSNDQSGRCDPKEVRGIQEGVPFVCSYFCVCNSDGMAWHGMSGRLGPVG